MKGFEAGTNLYIVKPSSPEMMVENIRMVLVAD
jgi:DNA-binding response OmpR family regulator